MQALVACESLLPVIINMLHLMHCPLFRIASLMASRLVLNLRELSRSQYGYLGSNFTDAPVHGAVLDIRKLLASGVDVLIR